ncbi:hypothetical protein HYU18_03090 [Candidatus Woesearchaeota archaeon]|nr:hypothetical protein [Candidatus Woesearchaeota archaeon]
MKGTSKGWRQLALQVLLVAVMAGAVVVLPGSDIYTHLHQAWLYNYMIDNNVLLEMDFSMLSGNQPIYGVGVFSYALAGVGWFALGSSIVKVLELLLFAGIILVSLALFRNREMLYFWYALLFVKLMLPDSYTYLFSAFLFYLGVYLVKMFRKGIWGDISISLSGLNHPYIAASNLSTIFLGRWPLFALSVLVLGVQLFVMKFLFFSGLVDFELDNLLDFAIRTAFLLFPFIAGWLPARFLRLASLKSAFAVVMVGIIFFYPVFFVPFEMGWKDGLACYYTKTYSEIPNLDGNVRVVDDCRNWIYVFPVRGMVTSLSPFFEGQYYHEKWEESQYLDYLRESEADYVIFCRDCEIKTKTLQETGEIGILSRNFPVYAELDSYVIFNVS